ncbi:MAG: Gfo/Idh/MocA family oxidoreductase [Chloroflexi bacterium]|nr:Gfo/Idh/MocA family oxidoreductase [Chloroflexota bacterium]
MAPIRVGIVGATTTVGGSGWGANAHVPALRSLPEYELRAVCTAHPETAASSARAFGTPLAYHDFDAMVADPTIDLISVVVRVPGHHSLVMKALAAGKHVFCEWPLGASVAEAEEMANLAAARGLRTAVGFQAQSDPVLNHARTLVADGYVGTVMTVHLVSLGQAIVERGAGRIWQGRRANGANTLTIAAGHAIDALCHVVGDFAEVDARLTTTIRQWRNPETGETLEVDSPDWISVAGRLVSGAEVSFLTATVPTHPRGTDLAIYGTRGSLHIAAPSLNIGPSALRGAQGSAALEALATPAALTLAPDAPAGPPRNVAHEYRRFAPAIASGERYPTDFAHAVQRHRLIAAIERSAAEGRRVAVNVEAAAPR